MSTENNRFNYAVISSVCLAFFCLIMFLYLLIKYQIYKSFEIDNYFIDFSSKIRSEGLTNFFKMVTHFGSILTIAILSFVLFLLSRNKVVKIFSIVNVGFVSVFCLIVKHLVHRPRPEGIALIEETGFSFPSAHTMGSVVFYGFLIFLILRFVKIKSLKILLSIILFVVPMLIGYTRVYLGVHFVTDVMAGILAGIVYLVVAIAVFIKLENKLKNKGEIYEKK